MPKAVKVTMPRERTDELLAKFLSAKGLISASVQRGISIKPPGDVVKVVIETARLPAFMRLLDEEKIGSDSAYSIEIDEPVAMVSADSNELIVSDTSEGAWEEMELEMARESNMSLNTLILMVVAGTIATAGIVTNALHVVVGAMLIAPGFEPFVRSLSVP